KAQHPNWPCLRCIFREPAGAGELPTCDTAGVLGPAAGVVASLQSMAAIKLLSGNAQAIAPELLSFDLWTNRRRAMDISTARDPNCPTCGTNRYEFLERAASVSASLCGQNAVQINLRTAEKYLDLSALEHRLCVLGQVTRTPYFLRCRLIEDNG